MHKCTKCGSCASPEAQFCIKCGNALWQRMCSRCTAPLAEEARFCTSCGTASFVTIKGETVLDYAILSLELALNGGDPARTLQASINCLSGQSNAECATVASLVAMSSHARTGDFENARTNLTKARNFYADHLNLSAEQRTKFVQDGFFLDDLQKVGDRDLQENPWLYLIMGHARGPRLPDDYKGDPARERQKAAVQEWAEFIDDRREALRGTLAHLYFTNGQYREAATHLERVVLIARRYESVSPVRIELLWPLVILGDCYWASGCHGEASARWRSGRSFEICCQLDPGIDNWHGLSLVWIDKAKSRLSGHKIDVPSLETSHVASRHLEQALKYMLEAEEYELRGVDLDELIASVGRAETRYDRLLDRATTELTAVEKLDPFVWAKALIQDRPYWFRYENLKSLLFQKKALLHLAHEQLAMAIACYKQAMDMWPVLSIYALMGGLQAACGLLVDARVTYQTCIDQAEELGSAEAQDDREGILMEVRRALNELAH